jgi:hypothetical protein
MFLCIEDIFSTIADYLEPFEVYAFYTLGHLKWDKNYFKMLVQKSIREKNHNDPRVDFYFQSLIITLCDDIGFQSYVSCHGDPKKTFEKLSEKIHPDKIGGKTSYDYSENCKPSYSNVVNDYSGKGLISMFPVSFCGKINRIFLFLALEVDLNIEPTWDYYN